MVDDQDDEDRRLFLEAMKDARPLARRSQRVPPPGAASQPGTTVGNRQRTRVPDDFVVEHVGDLVYGRAADVAEKLLRDLRRYEGPVAATLDLHGRTTAQAQRDIERFVLNARQRSQPVVLIVHGRGGHSGPGGGVLAEVTVQTLTAGEVVKQILAFATSPPALGGPGALLVRLRRR